MLLRVGLNGSLRSRCPHVFDCRICIETMRHEPTDCQRDGASQDLHKVRDNALPSLEPADSPVHANRNCGVAEWPCRMKRRSIMHLAR